MMEMISCLLFLTQWERVGYGSKVESIRTGSEDGSFWLMVVYIILNTRLYVSIVLWSQRKFKFFFFFKDKEPRGIIPLENVNVREVDDQKKQYCFEIYSTTNDRIKACKHDSDGKAIAGKHTVYRMSCSTCEDKNEWIKCIRDCISENPVPTASTKRKGSSK